MKRSIPTLAAAAVVVGGLAVTAPAHAANPSCASRGEFNRVHVGQTVRKTQQIIGSKGKVTIGGSFFSQRQWRACGGSGAFWVTITYVGGRVDNKIML